MKKTVYIVKERKIQIDLFSKILKEINVFEKLKAAKSICIKPNLAAGTNYDGSSGILVSTSMIENVIQCIRTINSEAEIIIAESDSTGNGYAYLKYEKQRYPDLIVQYPPMRLVDLTRERLKRINLNGYYFENVDLGESLFKSDFVISMAKIKTHNMTTITGATKNLFGCLPDTDKSRFHNNIDKVIADLSSIIHVDLAVVDGNPGMEGNGPVRGFPVDMNLILIGNNPIATDVVQAHIMGVDPQKVKHLRLAASRNDIVTELSNIEILGHPLENTRVNVKQIGFLQRSIVFSGLRIQSFGDFIYTIGHRIHFQKNMKGVFRVMVREVLFLIFKHSTLREIKRRLIK